jgi:hypothetical protein
MATGSSFGGNLAVNGTIAEGTAVSDAPVLVAGKDGGGAVRSIALDTGGNVAAIGAQADAAASSDTGTFSLLAFVKRALQNWTTLLSRIPALGLAAATAAVPVALPNVTIVTGTTQTALNTDLLTGTTSGWYDLQGYRSGSLQIITSAGISAGAVTFEQTDDTSAAPSGSTLFVCDLASTSAAPVSSVTLAASTVKSYGFNAAMRFIRARISTAVVGGTVQVTAAFSQVPFQTLLQPVNVSSITGSAPVNFTGVTGSTKGLGVLQATPAVISDSASGAKTTSGNSGNPATDFGQCVASLINVTAVSGTTPTLDLVLQESFDNAVTWQDIYHMPRITATGTYTSPFMTIGGRRRWVWTIGGTTPSFTFGITTSMGGAFSQIHRCFYDRAAGLLTATANATSATYTIEGVRQMTLKVSSGAATTGGAFKLQYSPDGTNWYDASAALTSVANSIVAITSTAGLQDKFARVICSSGGTGQTINYVQINGTS